tara:strand:- start:288 stop:458 length:171 start_codon:yes stop_codon:yes gene_type:complete
MSRKMKKLKRRKNDERMDTYKLFTQLLMIGFKLLYIQRKYGLDFRVRDTSKSEEKE